MAEETYEEIRAEAYEQIETMILTLDASQLLDHVDDVQAIRRGTAMFNVIVDRVLQARKQLDAALERSMEARSGPDAFNAAERAQGEA